METEIYKCWAHSFSDLAFHVVLFADSVSSQSLQNRALSSSCSSVPDADKNVEYGCKSKIQFKCHGLALLTSAAFVQTVCVTQQI